MVHVNNNFFETGNKDILLSTIRENQLIFVECWKSAKFMQIGKNLIPIYFYDYSNGIINGINKCHKS